MAKLKIISTSKKMKKKSIAASQMDKKLLINYSPLHANILHRYPKIVSNSLSHFFVFLSHAARFWSKSRKNAFIHKSHSYTNRIHDVFYCCRFYNKHRIIYLSMHLRIDHMHCIYLKQFKMCRNVNKSTRNITYKSGKP